MLWYQLAGLKLPLFTAPTIIGLPYVATDLWVGDSLNVKAATVTPGYPIPSPSFSLEAFVGAVDKGNATTYTVASGDVGLPLVVTQTSSNSKGTASASSATVTPIAPPSAWGQGLIGGNCSSAAEYSRLQFLNNAGQSGRVFQAYSGASAPSSNYAGGFDANGWPTSAFTYYVTAQIGGLDGQLTAGTYACSFRSSNPAMAFFGIGCTISNVTLDPDGITTHFTMVIGAAANAGLSFNGGVQYVDIPRDGVTPTWGGPEFWGPNLDFWGQSSVLRLMDICHPNGSTEVNWSDRNILRQEYGPTQPGLLWSWQRIARFIKAVVQRAGSRVQRVWINPPGLCDASTAQANNYSFQLATVLNTILAGIGVQLRIEFGNEPWNGQFVLFRSNLNTAITEAKILPWYLGEASNMTSIVGNGDGTVTVTTSSPLSAIPLPDGSTFAITNGQGVVVNYQQGNTTWGGGSITPDPNNTVDGTVVSVPVTVLSANSFKYTANGSPSGALPAASGSVQLALFFGLTSSLIKDGLSMNLYDIGNKVMVRRTFQNQQVWATVRPQDSHVLGLQQYGSAVPGAMSSPRVFFPYAKYIGSGSSAWYYGAAVAPYIKATGLAFTGVATLGGTTVTGVPWAATAVVGDQIKVNGAGTAGAALTTTVAAGSSGTTLNIADAVITTVTAGTIDYVAGPSASVTASISGTTMTVTAGSGLMAGMMGNGAPVNLAFNTRIVQQLTGTAGGAGTYQLNIAQTIPSTTISFAQTDGLANAMLAAVPAFGATLASHIYCSLLFGKVPLVYEGGPDTQAFPNQQIAIHTNPAMQTAVSNLLDAWFNQGGQEFNFYWLAPTLFNNSAQGAWGALQSYTDTASPKYAAIAAYNGSHVLAYANPFGNPGTFGPKGSAGAYVENVSQAKAGWQSFSATTGMLSTAGSSSDRYMTYLACLPRGQRWAIKVSGSDSASGTTGDVYVDGTLMGTVTLPQNGNGTSGSTVPGDSTTLQVGELTRGAHRIKIDFPIGRGANVGLFSVTPFTY